MEPDASDASPPDDEVLAFGPFRLFQARKLLLERNKPVPLGARAFDLLATLAGSGGRLVSKEELTARVWPDGPTDDANVRAHVAAVRKALGDGQQGRRMIVTTQGRGYRLIEPVSRTRQSPPPQAPQWAPARSDSLPRPVRTMFGRDDTVASLVEQLSYRRLTTVVGPGGIGKTTVALAVALASRASYRDGVRFVDLAPVADPALVPSVLAAALGLRASSDNAVADLLNILRDKHLLIVLDNCERVVEAAATLAEETFRSTRAVSILATSREPLRAEGEFVRQLLPLAAPPDRPGLTAQDALAYPAVQLFVERTAAAMDSFDLSDAEAPVVAEICRRLDGNALAIELAAVRVASLGTNGLASRLHDRFRLLTRGYRTSLPHHQTLRATFDWSHDLLPGTTRVVFRRLAVFAGNFTLAAACAIAGDRDIDTASVADQVANLVSASLLSADIEGQTATYRYLDSARSYAQERLVESSEFDQLSRRHGEYVLDVLRRAEADLAVLTSGQWLDAHSRQIDDVRAALDWAFSKQGDRQLGIELTIAATPLWSLLSLNGECRARVETALSHLDPAERRDGPFGMKLLAALGSAYAYTKGSETETTAAWKDVLRIAKAIEDVDYQLRALKGLWTDAYNTGQLSAANAFGDEFGRACARSADVTDTQLNERIRAMRLFYGGDLEGARRHVEGALARLPRRAGASDVVRFQFDQRMIAGTILVAILWKQGFPDQARLMAESTVEFAREAGHGRSVAYALVHAPCRVHLLNGDLAQADRDLADVFERARLDPSGQAHSLARLWQGVLRRLQGDAAGAMHLLSRALEGVPETLFRLHYALFLGEFAYAAGQAGVRIEAKAAIDRAIAICDRQGERWYFPELLRIEGEVALLGGDRDAASVAERSFRHSLDWARRQGAISWELRTASSLARLLRERARSQEARDLLTSVYTRFSEGFATHDLRVARMLLEQLA